MHDLPPPAHLMNVVTGKWGTYTLAAATEAGLFDALSDTPKSATDVASERSTNADATYRVLRALTVWGFVREDDEKRFVLLPPGQLLRTTGPSMAAMARFQGQTWHSRAWTEGLLHALKTGESGFEHVYGMDAWTWGKNNPEEFAVFNEAMTGFSVMSAAAVVSAYDFSSATRIADVGGGHGLLLRTVLDAAPQAKGVLFDLPGVVSGAKAVLGPVTDRCEIIGGSFFETAPKGCDVILLKAIIHDWGDDDSTKILRHCREGLNPNGKILIVEGVLPPPGEPSLSKLLDLEMLVITSGGRERTHQEFSELVKRAGLILTRVIPTPSPVSVIECAPA